MDRAAIIVDKNDKGKVSVSWRRSLEFFGDRPACSLAGRKASGPRVVCGGSGVTEFE